MPEWSNGAVSKTVVRSRVPRVRIPLSPPPCFAKASQGWLANMRRLAANRGALRSSALPKLSRTKHGRSNRDFYHDKLSERLRELSVYNFGRRSRTKVIPLSPPFYVLGIFSNFIFSANTHPHKPQLEFM